MHVEQTDLCVAAALTKKERSRVSAEDILTHEDPRTAVLVKESFLCISVVSEWKNLEGNYFFFFFS